MILAAIDFLNNNWLKIVFFLLLLAAFVTFLFYIYYKFIQKEKSFKDSLNEAKLLQIAITIDLEEKIVEKYYLYDQSHKDEIVSLDEFFVRFDKTNAEKLNNWLGHIARVTDFSKTRRIEVVMYDNNCRGVYLVELESYNAEQKKYYLIFKDMTESINVFRRVGKISVVTDNEDFYNKANERLCVVDDNANNFLVAIKYKEQSFATKELQSDILHLVEDSIYNKIDKMKFDNELLCLTSNGTFLLFSANVVNIKKYKHHIKKLLLLNSGVYNIIQNRFSYTINLVAGYTRIHKDERISIDKTLEAETAANVLMNKGRFVERMQLFDENLQNVHTVLNNKLLAVEKVVTQNLFSLNLVPIIKTKSKFVSGYYVSITLPHSLNMDLTEFMNLIKQRSFRFRFYTQVFEQMLKITDVSNKVFYFSFDFENLKSIMEAYQSNEEYSQLNFYFCVEFSNITMQNTDLITIEKKLASFKENANIKFGITYNTLTTIYLNDKIYSKTNVVLLSGQLIEQSLDQHTNESLIDVYTKVAASYNQEVIGLNVNSLAIYEILNHYKVSKVGGSFLTPYVENDRIVDKSILKVLSEIENRTY